MRILSLGVDDEGHSYLVDEQEVTPSNVMPGVAVASLYTTSECPPIAPRPGTGHFGDMGLAPGTVSWMVVDMEPYSEDDEPTPLATEMHYNNSMELLCVLEGSVNTILGHGALDLRPGDCVSMPGVDHATRAGPEGARVLSISIGLAPRD